MMDDHRLAGIGFGVGSATGGDASNYHGLALRDQRDSLSDAAMERIVRDAVLYGEGWGQWFLVDEDEMPADANMLLFADRRTPSGDALSLGALDKRLRMRACDADHVYEDPHDDTPDRSQMDWLIEVQRMTVERRNRVYPNAKRLPAGVFDQHDRADWWLGRASRMGGGPERDRIVRVAHYYRRLSEMVDFVWTPGFGEEARREDRLSAEQQALLAAATDVRRFRREVSVLWLHVTDGAYELMPAQRIPWGRIPYFRAVGDELVTVDGQVIKRGMVYELKDANKWMDVSASEVVQNQAVSGKDGWVAPSEAIRNHPDSWRDTRVPKSVREYDAFPLVPGPGGARQEPVPAPFYHSSRPDVESGVASMASARELIGLSTGSADAQDRDTSGAYRSGVAIDRMDRMAASNRQKYVWNAEKITAWSSGSIWKLMSPHVYDRVGRRLYISGQRSSDDDVGVIIGIPFLRQDGKLIPLGPEVGDAKSLPDPSNPEVQHDVHRFDPPSEAVKITTHATNLAQAGRAGLAETLAGLMQGNPGLTPALAEPMLAALGDRFPVKDAQERVRAMFPQPVDPSKGVPYEKLPEMVGQLQQQIQQMGQQMQALQQAADQTNAAREIESEKASSRRAEVDAKIEADLQREKMRIDAQRELKVVDVAADAEKQYNQAEADAVMKGLDAGMASTRPAPSKGGNDGNAGS